MIEFLISSGWSRDLAVLVSSLLGGVVLGSFGLGFIIFSIWFERKFASRVQDRVGPNRVGPYGLFQTFADLGKLLTKEDITPAGADRFVYNIAPLMSTAAVLLMLAVVPFNHSWIGADLNVGALYFTAVGSLGTLAILLAGWGSNNKYALLGAFRVIAQLISYEIPMVLTIAVPVLLAGSMSMMDISQGQSIAYIFVSPIAALIFFISQIAEAGRSPFDLLEAESEIIAGYNIEYSGFKFAMFYAAEFMHAFVSCLLFAVLFLGGYHFLVAGQPGYELLGFLTLMGKMFAAYLVQNLIRMTTPRIRIDLMMAFNWKFLVPLAIANLLVVAFLARLFVPDYAYAQQLVDGGGFAGLIGGLFGPGFIAELPRAIACLVASVVMFGVANRFLRLNAEAQKRQVAEMVQERRRSRTGASELSADMAAGD